MIGSQERLDFFCASCTGLANQIEIELHGYNDIYNSSMQDPDTLLNVFTSKPIAIKNQSRQCHKCNAVQCTFENELLESGTFFTGSISFTG